MQSVIGVTGNYSIEEQTHCLRDYYIKSVQRAGGVPVIIPPLQDESIIEQYLNLCHGFVLSGGGDVDPYYWGEHPGPELGEINPWRDYFELCITRRILNLHIPVLGICRGCQVLNIAAGGSVIQHISSSLNHHQNAPRNYAIHDVHIEKTSKLGNILQTENIRVNSFHHQAVKNLGQNMLSCAYASDGIIEAIERVDFSFAIGVQWHPECLEDKNSAGIFKALVEAADVYRFHKTGC